MFPDFPLSDPTNIHFECGSRTTPSVSSVGEHIANKLKGKTRNIFFDIFKTKTEIPLRTEIVPHYTFFFLN